MGQKNAIIIDKIVITMSWEELGSLQNFPADLNKRVEKCINLHNVFTFNRRTEHKLVHRFEKDEFGKPFNLVKEFRRSAAGHCHNKPNELRPPDVCLKTAKYLIQE